MSTRVTRAEARRRMAALQEPRPVQGWSETRPTRAPRRALERTRDEDSAPEPAVSSDSDVEVVGDPAVEERVATPEGGGGRSDTARDDGRRRSGTPEEPLGGGLSGHRGDSETVPRPGAVGRGAAAVDGGGGEMADAAAAGPRGGGGAMACPLARGGGRGATAVGGTGGGFVGGATHPQIRGRGAQPEERGWGRAMRAIPSAVVARGTTHSPLRGGVAHRRRSRRRSTVGHAAVEAGPATHAAIHGATATGGAHAKRGVDRAADATTAEGGSPPGTGGGAVGGADGGAGRAREHTGVRGRGRTVAAADADMDVAREARDRTDEGGAQDMGGGGTQGEPSGPPDEKPTGCVGSADTKHGPANTGDDGSDGGGGVAGEGTVGVARATGHPKTSVAASSFDARIDAPAAAVHAASFGPGRRRLARGRQERVAGGN
ncbi:uncharacterized PE-PGRS family protein PE_PGRS46-like [Drosophila suzukii]|uniref:Uncharacterized PE-PGRS family protein PE_PGRS46-like n=1 Tax=Drosophila suzukii TaxID=28584 RepID=A0ABM4TZP2_DROSZ